MFKFVVLLSVYFVGSSSLIVPGEIPTLLTLIYSNIPTIKKGTDSRLGWGFRLGNRADFQVLVELGPQTNTQPLGNQDSGSSSSKRDALPTLRDTLWAQRQQEKRTEKPHFSESQGGQWMKEWSQQMQPVKAQNQILVIEDKPIIKGNEEEPVLGIGEIDARLVIPEDSEVKSSHQKFKKKVPSSTQRVETTTLKEDALDNVEILD